MRPVPFGLSKRACRGPELWCQSPTFGARYGSIVEFCVPIWQAPFGRLTGPNRALTSRAHFPLGARSSAVEHLTFNQRVEGSIPSGLTNHFNELVNLPAKMFP